jgi:long-chain acyl-CoA synthetase
VKGPNVMQGYYDNEKLNQASFTSDGYFRTGDLGHLTSMAAFPSRGGRRP